jgi:hypothetical protein
MTCHISLEAFAATEFNEISPGRQPESSVLVIPKCQHILKMGTELDPETSYNLHILMRLSARENFVVWQWQFLWRTERFLAASLAVSFARTRSSPLDRTLILRRSQSTICYPKTLSSHAHTQPVWNALLFQIFRHMLNVVWCGSFLNYAVPI